MRKGKKSYKLITNINEWWIKSNGNTFNYVQVELREQNE